MLASGARLNASATARWPAQSHGWLATQPDGALQHRGEGTRAGAWAAVRVVYAVQVCLVGPVALRRDPGIEHDPADAAVQAREALAGRGEVAGPHPRGRKPFGAGRG